MASNVVRGSLLSVGAFVVLAGAAAVVTSALGIPMSPADTRTVLIILAIAALFIGFNV